MPLSTTYVYSMSRLGEIDALATGMKAYGGAGHSIQLTGTRQYHSQWEPKLMLDVHILTLNSTKPEYLQQALDSIEIAKSRCSIPVNVFVVEGVPNHLGRSRKKGYSYGTGAYVTHVDHDDWIHENALLYIERVIEQQSPQSITTGEYIYLDAFSNPNLFDNSNAELLITVEVDLGATRYTTTLTAVNYGGG